MPNLFAIPEGWKKTDAELIGARVIGRCAIVRHVGDQERFATGLTLELDNGLQVGVFWQHDVFDVVPLQRDKGG